MTTGSMLDHAYAAYDAGLSVLPIRDDGTKAPAVREWTALQWERVKRDQLATWFSPGSRCGLAVTGGKASGNLEILDFDDADFDLFIDTAHDADLGDLMARLLNGFHETTPSGGHHLVYRCDTVEGNQKLAEAPGPDPARPTYKPRVLIETRGQGGYAIVAPTNGTVHENGGRWELVSGGCDTIPTITPEEREDLFAFARSFDEMPVEEPRASAATSSSERGYPDAFSTTAGRAGLSPGDDFRAKHGKPDTFRPILEAAGWTFVYERNGVDHYRRPDKTRGISATFGHAGTDLLYVFTTSTEFEAGRGYNPFAVYTILNHNGDFSEAAKALCAEGYGDKPATETVSGKSENVAQDWPVLDEAAYFGWPGEVVRAIDPHTEADPVLVLATALVMGGNVLGRGPRFNVGDVPHHCNLNAAAAGRTSKGRKGTSLASVRRIVVAADESWAAREQGGLSSGEGLIWAVRDPISKTMPVKEKGRTTGTETVIVDDGVDDKRLLNVEEELASVLKASGRDGSILSETIRRAWDGREVLRTMTKNSPAVATGAHVSILAHITFDELRVTLTETEKANGLANRYVWLVARRSKTLPEPTRLDDGTVTQLARRLTAARATAIRTGTYTRTENARALWKHVYGELSDEVPGLTGAIIGRAEAQVARLSLVYAALSGAREIDVDHLLAALAFWDYCEASVAMIFGDAVGDPIADRILAAVRGSVELDRTALLDLFGRNVAAAKLDAAIARLVTGKRLNVRTEPTKGRPRTIYTATPRPAGGGRDFAGIARAWIAAHVEGIENEINEKDEESDDDEPERPPSPDLSSSTSFFSSQEVSESQDARAAARHRRCGCGQQVPWGEPCPNCKPAGGLGQAA